MVCRNTVKERGETHLCVVPMSKTLFMGDTTDLQKSCPSDNNSRKDPIKKAPLMLSFEWSDFHMDKVPSDLLVDTQHC